MAVSTQKIPILFFLILLSSKSTLRPSKLRFNVYKPFLITLGHSLSYLKGQILQFFMELIWIFKYFSKPYVHELLILLMPNTHHKSIFKSSYVTIHVLNLSLIILHANPNPSSKFLQQISWVFFKKFNIR